MGGHIVDKGEMTSACNILVDKRKKIPQMKPMNKCMIILK
jgi:hypothetical protein